MFAYLFVTPAPKVSLSMSAEAFENYLFLRLVQDIKSFASDRRAVKWKFRNAVGGKVEIPTILSGPILSKSD